MIQVCVRLVATSICAFDQFLPLLDFDFQKEFLLCHWQWVATLFPSEVLLLSCRCQYILFIWRYTVYGIPPGCKSSESLHEFTPSTVPPYQGSSLLYREGYSWNRRVRKAASKSTASHLFRLGCPVSGALAFKWISGYFNKYQVSPP